MSTTIDEQQLLASLDASLQEQDVYEEQVLREATEQLAPSLVLTADGGGFPSLASLGPSYDSRYPERYNPLADEPHVLSVLKKTRRLIQDYTTRVEKSSSNEQQQPALDRLYLKEQMLLSFLTAVVGSKSPEELPVRPEDERLAEQKRYAAVLPPQYASRDACLEEDYDDRKPAARPAPSNTTNAILRVRGSMMQHKRLLAPLDDDDDENAQAVVTAEQKEQLKQLRLARKQKRARRWHIEEIVDSESDSTSEEEFSLQGDDDDTEEDKGDVDDDDNEEDSADKDRDDEESASSNNALDTVDTSIAKAASAASTICPLCQETVYADDAVELDTVLSQHMNLCQQGRPRRRSTRGLAMTTTTYAELPPETATAAKQSATTKPARRLTKKKKIKPSQSKKKRRRVSKPKLDATDDLEEINYEDRVDDWIEHGLARMKQMNERDDQEVLPDAEMVDGLFVPAWINNRLFGYQREGLRWMWGLHQQRVGGIVGDEMGLGKTVQVCSFLGILAGSRKLRSVLVIAPATMLQHWLNELAIWAPGLRRILVHQSGENDGVSRSVSSNMLRNLSTWLLASRADRLYEAIDAQDQETMPPHSFCGTGCAVITTYESLRRNPTVYESHDWSYVVLDEAQRIRNPDADITLACKRIKTPHRLALSGTPIQNDLRELWSLFDFVYPGRVGMLQTFEQEFADPIKRGGYSNASPIQVQLAYRCSLVLRDLINPYLLRRQKKDVKEVKRMPGKTEHVLFCRLSVRQRVMYEAFLASDEVRRVLRGNNQLFAAVTMLRKICNHPDLVCSPDQASMDSFLKNGYVNEADLDEDVSDFEDLRQSNSNLVERSGKLEVLSQILPLWHKQGHRVLIFCQWVKMLTIVQQFTMRKGWKFGRIDGKTSVAARQRLVDSFNNDASYFGLLCTTQTGGVGLNLTGADRIILYDPAWNPMTDAQARERAWRFGQQREVTVYRLITAGTIEEKIYQRQIFKTALSNKVLQDPRQRRLFSQRDLRDLFTLKADIGSVRAGSDGITETGGITSGGGVIDPDEEPTEESLKDNQETLEHVMKSKGLAGVFDHNFVEQDCRQKSTSVREMEEHAKRVAQEAAKALKMSVEGLQTETTAESRFDTMNGGKGLVGSRGSANDSNSLLASLRLRNEAVATEGKDGLPDDEVKLYTKLLSRIQDFVRGRRPSTEAVMTAFADVTSSKDVAVFRRMLKSIAEVHQGKWYLKEDAGPTSPRSIHP